MSMSKPTETVSVYTQSILPPEFIRGRRFIKLTENMEKTIDSVVFSSYPAKNKEGNQIVRKDGSVLLNTTAYVGFDDGTFASVKSDTAIAQLASISEGYTIPSEPEVVQYPVETTKVRIVSIEVKYGQKSYPAWAFDPIY